MAVAIQGSAGVDLADADPAVGAQDGEGPAAALRARQLVLGGMLNTWTMTWPLFPQQDDM